MLPDVCELCGRSERLLQETYTLTHTALGTFLLLVVPVGLMRQQSYYEAVVNRFRCEAPAPPPLPTPRLRRRRAWHGGETA